MSGYCSISLQEVIYALPLASHVFTAAYRYGVGLVDTKSDTIIAILAGDLSY
jgi:hypothetical protein